ncbi:unnamed protein product, partial [Rotaria sp. Silwood2]
MFYYAFFIAFILFTAVSHGKPATFRVNQPKPCCIPSQFSVLLTVSSAQEVPNAGIGASYAVFNYSSDANRRIIAMKGISYSVIDQKESNVWVIENIAEKQAYIIDGNTKKCIKNSYPVEPFRCISESATYLYSSMYGYGNSQSQGDTWYVEDNDRVSFITVSSDGNCIPMNTNSFIGNPRELNSLTMSNYVSNIKDP